MQQSRYTMSYSRSNHWICVSITTSIHHCPDGKIDLKMHSTFSYDLKELSGKSYTVERNDKKYVFGICTDAKQQCGENVGACSVSHPTSMGAVSNVLQLSEEKSDSPFLLYKSGAICGPLDRYWSTKIEFVCQTDGMPAGPKIIEDTSCQLIIHFATKLVCNNEVGY